MLPASQRYSLGSGPSSGCSTSRPRTTMPLFAPLARLAHVVSSDNGGRDLEESI